jgi:hypothetical protein
MEKQENQYHLVFLTAILSGIFSVVGIYSTSVFQADHLKVSKSADFKISSYITFLNKVPQNHSSKLSKINYAGVVLKNSSTDMDVQYLENYLAGIESDIDEEFLIEINQEFNILRVSGSENVKEIINDIMSCLVFDSVHKIDISKYPDFIQHTFHNFSGEQSYIETKVTNDKRLSLILAAHLYQHLLSALGQEISNNAQ